MKVASKRLILGVAVVAAACLIPSTRLGGQTSAQTKPLLAEQVFKNVPALKDIPVDDFMGTMGIMCASLGFDCSDCHNGAGTDKVNWADDTPRKVIARRMVQMVQTINKTNFNNRQMVTCWTCHRNRDRPVTTPQVEVIYGMPPAESDDVIRQLPGLPPPAQILDKYIQAVGGAQKLAGLKSFEGEGKSVGFGGFGGVGEVHWYSQAPDKHTLQILYHDSANASEARGDTTRSYDGKTAWLRTPLNVLGEYQLTGSELDGARLDAMLAFPGSIKQDLTDLRSGPTTTISDLPGPSSQTDQRSSVMVGQNKPVNVVQGTGPNGLLATLYFDRDSGLLLRLVRYGKSPIGRYPSQIDFSDYREVDGIKFPFLVTFAWLDGRDAIQLDKVKLNGAIDQSHFAKPASLKK